MTRANGFIDIVHHNTHKGAITQVLCRVQSRASWIEESQANAQLIEAAPDMLEMLKDAHSHIDDDALRQRIGRLIIKASGEKE